MKMMYELKDVRYILLAIFIKCICKNKSEFKYLFKKIFFYRRCEINALFKLEKT